MPLRVKRASVHMPANVRIGLIRLRGVLPYGESTLKQTASFHERKPGAASRTELRETLQEVDRVATRLKLGTEVKRRASDLCTEAKAAPFGHGIPQAVLAASTLYVACREERIPVTLREFAYASGSDPRDVGRCYLELLENMHITRPSMNGKGYVSHLALKRPVSEQARKMSQEMINRMSAEGLGGRNPMTLAAAALYLACCSLGENVTQSQVAEAAGVGEESVRECCKAIRLLEKQTAG
jgi:transcription initiation factor TFIIB